MATGSVGYTAGSGTLIRVVTNAAVDSGAAQQIVSHGDSAGNVATVKAASTAAVATDTAEVVALHPSSPLPAGTNTVGNVGAASNFVAAGSLGALNATYEGSVDCSLYSSLRLAITGTWVGTITFQVSNDQTNWQSKLLAPSAASAGFTATANGQYSGDIGAKFFRVTMTSYTSGTAVPQVLYTSAPASVVNPILGSAGNLIGAIGVGSLNPSSFATTSTASTNATIVKGSAGNLQELTVSNPTATVAYFKLFNKASAPTVGTDLPIAIYRVAATGSAGDTVQPDLGANGKRFTTGIAWALTGAVAAADTTNAVAGVLVSGTYV